MNQSEFVDSLIKDAEKKAAEIITKAEKEAEDIISSLDSRKKSIREETDLKAQKKIEQIELLNDAAIKAETRRLKLKLREKLNEEIMAIFYKEIEDKINTPEYCDFLAKLIAEGAIALDASIVVVKCSFKEKITEEIIKKSKLFVKEYNGQNIEIRLSNNSSLSKQGIIVETENGRLSYNNQIETRLRRFKDDIGTVIFNSLEKE